MRSLVALSRSPDRVVDAAAAALALVLHVGLVVGSPRASAIATPPRREAVHLFDVEPPPAPMEEPAPAPTETPTPSRVPRERVADRAPPPPPAPSDATPSPAEDLPLDLGAVVVSGVGGVAFGPTGGGGTGAPRSSPPAPVGPQPTAPGPRVARGASDLSSDVRPPAGLDRLLESHYPAEARAQGTTGSARVRLRVDEQGRVVSATITNESPAGVGFGSACRRMLLEGPTWEPALDPAGVPIARVGRDFRCRFELR